MKLQTYNESIGSITTFLNNSPISLHNKNLVTSGKIFRYSCILNKPHKKDCWYIAFENDNGHISVVAGSFNTKDNCTKIQFNSWEDPLYKDKYSKEDINKWNIHACQVIKSKETKIEKERHKSFLEQSEIFEKQKAKNQIHPYLEYKQISTFNSLNHKIINEPYKNNLWIPLYKNLDNTDLTAIQLIYNKNGKFKKLFIPGSIITKKSASITLKTITPKTKAIYIAEGYATGVSLQKVTNYSVVVTFGSNNLYNVAKKIRKEFPNIKIFISVDMCNTGKDKAKKIEESMNNIALFCPITDQGNDSNDLHCFHGIEELRKQVKEFEKNFIHKEDNRGEEWLKKIFNSKETSLKTKIEYCQYNIESKKLSKSYIKIPKQHIWTIGALSNHGKTAIAVHIAKEIVKNKEKVLYIGTEESLRHLTTRFVTSDLDSQYNIAETTEEILNNLSNNQEIPQKENINEDELKTIKNTFNWLKDNLEQYLYLRELDIATMESIKKLIDSIKPDCVIIDYGQNIEGLNKKTRYEELKDIFQNLLNYIKKEDIAMIIPCQFNDQITSFNDMDESKMGEGRDVFRKSSISWGLWNCNKKFRNTTLNKASNDNQKTEIEKIEKDVLEQLENSQNRLLFIKEFKNKVKGSSEEQKGNIIVLQFNTFTGNISLSNIIIKYTVTVENEIQKHKNNDKAVKGYRC